MFHAPYITKDFIGKKLTIEKIFNAPLAKIWRAHTDDIIMAKWWGPKEWPATSISFDFREGGHWHYCMTGPDGTEACGWVDYLEIDPMKSYRGKDCFADKQGNKSTELPSNNWLTRFEDLGEQTKIIVELSFEETADMQTIIDMGFEAGFSDALNNLDLIIERGEL
jgi:uncharacterized protein YndB with AHSA1/START domain